MRQQIETHVEQCRVCEQFGGDFSRLLESMRRQLAEPDRVDEAVLERLRRVLPR